MITEVEKCTFAAEMARRLKDMEARAKAVGSNMTQVTKNTGIARATFERWQQRPPQTIAKLDEMEAEVQKMEREFQTKTADGAQ